MLLPLTLVPRSFDRPNLPPCASSVSAFSPAAASLSQVSQSRAALSVMARGAPERAAPKKAAPKKPVSRGGPAQEGKGGILPWVTNTPGTYTKPHMLSAIDFTSDEGDQALLTWSNGATTFWVGGNVSGDEAVAIAESLE